MSKLFNSLFAVIIIFTVSISVFAQIKGKGEVKGEVMSSWLSGEQVRFRLSINTQQNWSGPRLSNPNNFVYNGSDKMSLTEGDKVSLIYNSSDGDYIIAQSLEFTEDRPGEITQTSFFLPILGGLAGIVIFFAIIYLIRRKTRELHTT